MLRRYYYLVNPSCTMAAQGMKTKSKPQRMLVFRTWTVRISFIWTNWPMPPSILLPDVTAEAWNQDGVFTSRRNQEVEERFNDLYHIQFRITVAERDDVWVCSVKRVEMGREHAVTIPKEPVRGSHFGRCTCGVDRQDSAPCEHMAAVAASSCLPGVTRHNVMPYWWTRAHWRKQIPQEPLGNTNVSMSSIIAENEPDHNLCYCPDWTANQKSGRPKKDKRKKSVLESATGSKGAKRATGVKRAWRYCQICGKYNHITNECWKLGSNAHTRPGFLNTITEEGDGAPIDGAEGTTDASEEWRPRNGQ